MRQRMAVPTGSANSGGFVSIEVESKMVERVLNSVWFALSGPNLEHWLDTKAHPHFAEEIDMRFAVEGDRKSGSWQPLEESTVRIREQQGFGPDPINVRTGQLEDFVSNEYETRVGDGWAIMDLPGESPNPVTAAKLETAQRGRAPGENPITASGTPARPVLAVDETDMMALLEGLSVHIITQMKMHSGGMLL